jgi:hypothetical protein
MQISGRPVVKKWVEFLDQISSFLFSAHHPLPGSQYQS